MVEEAEIFDWNTQLADGGFNGFAFSINEVKDGSGDGDKSN